MKFGWDDKKNEELMTEEGRASFDVIVSAIATGGLRSIRPNTRHAGQSILIVEQGGNIHVVPFEMRDGGETIWLITSFPDRREKKVYGTE